MKAINLVNSDKQAIVIDEKFERLSQFKWYMNKNGTMVIRNHTKHAYTFVSISMANEVMQDYESKFDHWNGDPLDNRDCNLRKCTTTQNSQNRSKRKRKASSKYKGVCWSKSMEMWRAYITVNGKTIYLGYFTCEIEAAVAYDDAAILHFGEFACLNFPLYGA